MMRRLRLALALLAAPGIAVICGANAKAEKAGDEGKDIKELEALKEKVLKKEEELLDSKAKSNAEPSFQSRRLADMSRDEIAQVRSKLMEQDLRYKDGVPYKTSWAIDSGVIELNIPAYEGWVNRTLDPKVYSEFESQGRPGEKLAAVLINKDYVEQTGSPYVNYFCLIWKPSNPYLIYGEGSFAQTKEEIKEVKIERRREVAERQDFETFDDYVNFKFGKDDLMENFADDYQMLATEDERHMTYFYTSEFIAVTDEGIKLREPMVGTDTVALVRNKLLRFEIRKFYEGTDDVNEIIRFTETFINGMRIVNGEGPR